MIERARALLRRNWWIALVVAVLASAVPTAYLLSPPTSVGFADWVDVFGTLTSVGLSLVLAYLYREMNDTQSRQTELIENQQRLMERRQEPVVEIRDVAVAWGPDGTRVVLDVANKGASPLLDLTLGLDLVLYGESAEKLGVSTENPVLYDGEEWTIEAVDAAFRHEDATDAIGETHLEPGEAATLVAPVEFRRCNQEDGSSVASSFEAVLDLLDETQIGVIKLHASLLYAGWDGRLRGQRLESGKAELTALGSLDDLFASERPHTKLPDGFLANRRRRPTRWAE